MKNKILFVTFILLGSSLYAQQEKAILLNDEKPAVFKLSLPEYTDKVHAIWASQIICGLIGLEFENSESSVKWVNSLPKKMEYAPLDDDWYYEMVTIKAFEKYGNKMTIEQLGKQWLNDSCGVWGSSKLAKWAMLRGIKPPDSGHPYYNRAYFTIGPQFTSDVYGALTPGMPNVAGKLARYYGHINGYAEGTDGAVFVAGLISTAFNEKDIKVVVQKAANLLNKKSPYRQCLDMVISSAQKGATVKEVINQVETYWRVEYPANNNAVANGGIIAACLWFGESDFLKTLNLVCSAADYSDADCNAANAGSVIAAMYGTRAIPADLLKSIGTKIKGNGMGKDNFIPPVDESIAMLVDRTVKVGIAILKDNGVILSNGILSIPNQQVMTQPAELFGINDIVQHWKDGWQIERSVLGSTYVENEVLVTYPKVAPLGMYLYKTEVVEKQDSLILTVAADPGKCWELKVLADNDKLFTKIIESNSVSGKWQTISIDISKYKGKQVLFRLFQNIIVPDKFTGNAYWKNIIIK